MDKVPYEVKHVVFVEAGIGTQTRSVILGSGEERSKYPGLYVFFADFGGSLKNLADHGSEFCSF